MSDPDFVLHYRLDQRDRIIDTGGAWDRFAEENDGGVLVGKSVLGRSLYDFISGDVSRMFVRTIIDGVRILQRPRNVPYRCDSPGLRRYMEMSLTLEVGGEMLLAHRQLRTEESGRKFDFQVGLQPVRQMIIRCSHCNGLKRHGVWGEAEDILPATTNALVPVIYGVCPRCLELVRQR